MRNLTARAILACAIVVLVASTEAAILWLRIADGVRDILQVIVAC